MPEGCATFSLHRTAHASVVAIWVYFEVQDLDNYVNELVKKGVILEELPNDKPWLWRESQIKDPDNNQLILYFAGDNRKNPQWRI